jgi:L-serine dehydratase
MNAGVRLKSAPSTTTDACRAKRIHVANDMADVAPVRASGRPAQAARQFAQALRDDGLLDRTWRVRCELQGIQCGRGHDRHVGTAVILGLEGEEADCIDSPAVARRLRHIHDKSELRLLGTRRIAFDRRRHLTSQSNDATAPACPAVRLSAFDPAGSLLLETSYPLA